MLKTNTWTAHETDTIVLDEANEQYAVVPGSPPLNDIGSRRVDGQKLEEWVSIMGPSWKPLEACSSTEQKWLTRVR